MKKKLPFPKLGMRVTVKSRPVDKNQKKKQDDKKDKYGDTVH